MKKILFTMGLLILVFGSQQVMASPANQGVSGSGNVDDDVFIITCDNGLEVVGGARFTFININPGFSYTVTAIGIDGFDPVLAVATAPGEGSCNDDAPAAEGSEVAVPGVGLVEANNLTAQVRVQGTGGNVDVFVGGFQGSTGQFAMIIEGLAINPADELDAFLISVPQVLVQEELGVYMISRDGSRVDPYMEVYGGDGLQTDPLDFNQVSLLALCDDAGVGDCSDTPEFPGGGIFIRNGNRYEAGNTDAGISASLGTTDRFLYAFGSYNGASTGDYGIVVIGTAAGNLETPPPASGNTSGGSTTGGNDSGGLGSSASGMMGGGGTGSSATTCNNVAVSVTASSVFNDDYAAAFMLDDDPTTGWASSGEEATEALIFTFNGEQTIDRLLINGYTTSGDEFVDDSLREFAIMQRLPNGEFEVVTTGEAPLEPGYQTYSFPPITLNEIGILMISNWGGPYYEIADVMVCAQ